MSDALLKVGNLDAWYGRAQVLFDLSLDVRRGDVVALMGRNGAGKSTTMKAVMGLLERKRASRGWVSASCRKTGASSPT